MSKKADNITGARSDSSALPLQPEAPPARISSADVPPGAPAPQFSRFGSGGDGGGERGSGRLARPGYFERLGQFLRDVRSEMRRVSWPSAKDVQNTTIITVVAVIFFAVYLFAVDQGLAFLITQLERFVNWLVGSI